MLRKETRSDFEVDFEEEDDDVVAKKKGLMEAEEEAIADLCYLSESFCFLDLCVSMFKSCWGDLIIYRKFQRELYLFIFPFFFLGWFD